MNLGYLISHCYDAALTLPCPRALQSALAAYLVTTCRMRRAGEA